jgi:phage terminase large subunit-like protein
MIFFHISNMHFNIFVINYPYDLWVQQKWITTTPGAVVDYEYIKMHIRNMEKDIYDLFPYF